MLIVPLMSRQPVAFKRMVRGVRVCHWRNEKELKNAICPLVQVCARKFWDSVLFESKWILPVA